MPPHLWYNPAVPSPSRVPTIVLATAALLSACAEVAPETLPTATITLLPYHTLTATPTPRRPTATLPPIATPGPSPTPLAHLVQANETLLGIALRYGVSLEDLLAANPGINPRFLSIGQAVIIPGPEGQPVAALAPTPTPVSAVVSPARCFRTLSDSLWCMASVGSPLDAPIAGVAAMMTLVDEEGRVLESQVAHTPLRVVPPGASLPLAAWFASPAPRPASVVVVLLSAMTGEAESRARPLQVLLATDSPSEDRLSWSVGGTVGLEAAGSAAVSRVTVVAVGYAADGSVVGFAVREWGEEQAAGGPLPFSMSVYSLGPELERVEVLAEALSAE